MNERLNRSMLLNTIKIDSGTHEHYQKMLRRSVTVGQRNVFPARDVCLSSLRGNDYMSLTLHRLKVRQKRKKKDRSAVRRSTVCCNVTSAI